MQSVIDIPGASGGAYRFRRVDSAQALPATAGNFLLVEASEGAPKIVGCGTARSLRGLRQPWEAAASRPALYIRLNVSQQTRLEEHEDIISAQRPSQILLELE